MQALTFFRIPSFNLSAKAMNMFAMCLIVALGCMAALGDVSAATSTGTALKPAFDALNDIANGYGKQLLVLMGFIAAGFAVLAANAASAVLKFIGYIVFLSVGLAAALTLSGAVI